jgi:hypothetical protein
MTPLYLFRSVKKLGVNNARVTGFVGYAAYKKFTEKPTPISHPVLK